MPLEMGRVRLVGAGPGAVDLMTLRALRAVESAQALLYDALVPDEILALAPPGCVRIQTGKRAGKASMGQETINRLMLRLARRGLEVVRLKGGDPSVFGRSGEERAFLEAHGVEVEIVPGVTAASAAAAQFAFPLSHRGEARRVTFTTARVQDGAIVESGWSGLADTETTLVLYMARDAARAAADRLIAEGRAPGTPALAIENAGRPEARIISTILRMLGQEVENASLSGPVLLVVGDVAGQARAAYAPSLRSASARS
ncbi:uroporphyrinogen-III C-methyltransferase [Phenylobacterium sp. LH3H17]|uniref:uroporphyrinogen-III C-methyltransferase n=1 Tax=Phenylobacterium sp. LH3H17 TaxID=2903901 RepID=UPI003530E58B